ncbi:MAG: hypothetical protein HFG81_00650 [Dorea sp.]|nr:hypothetical protein [Dorea sp.]
MPLFYGKVLTERIKGLAGERITMNSEVRLIRLCRRTNDGGVQDISESQQYLSTDYFDVLHSVKKELWDDFDSIMGIGDNGKQNINEIAIQSYTLYCDGQTMDKYGNRKYYGDPFDDAAGIDKPFLSMIQVHISPEIVARLKSEHSKSAYGFYIDIEDDIHDILNDFMEKYSDSICYKVYRLLSTGDFDIVIRSRLPEASYEISTALRKRYVCTCNNGNAAQEKIVLYKTYTLLTMAHNVINTGEDEEDFSFSEGNQFVIRCCYSNKYWSEKQKVDDFWRDEKEKSNIKIYSLNGRYDFTVYLTEKEFREVFPHIIQYKSINLNTDVDDFEGEKIDYKDADKVKYLIYLMKHGYLSYVNERYLLEHRKIHVNENDKSKFPMVEKQDFVAECNIQDYRHIEDLYDNVFGRIYALCTNRKKLIHYMELLHKIIRLCQTINQLSDTRISVSVLLELTEIVLNSVNCYLDYMDYEEDSESDILGLVEAYLRESVGALDAYSRYIRNNNLQYLQTPNYNIESNTSMEKVLIALSEYAYIFIKNYMNCETTVQEHLGLTEKTYIPIVVPNLGKDKVTVEVMFPEWNIYRYQKDTGQARKYLIIITCPTVKEMGNVPVIMTSLLHEIAHQFRYEKRKIRNDTILRYTLQDFFEILSDGIVNEFEEIKSNTEVRLDLTILLRDALLEEFLGKWLIEVHKLDKRTEGIDFITLNWDAPLAYYEECIWNSMEKFLESWDDSVDIPVHVNQFVRQILQYIQVDKEEIKEQLKKIEKSLEGLLEDEISVEEWQSCNAQLKDGIIRLYVEGVAELLPKDLYSDWLKDWSKILEKELYSIWDILTDEIYPDESQDENKDAVMEIQKAAIEILQFLTKQEEGQYRQIIYSKLKEKYVKSVYKNICEKWKNNYEEGVKTPSGNIYKKQFLNEVGRYFGIDYFTDGNEKIFVKVIKENINNRKLEALDKIRTDIGLYREETADMFMCRMMSLNEIGYINLIASEINIEGQISDAYLQRCIRVIAVLWCKMNVRNFDEFMESYQVLCTNIFRKVRDYVNRLLKYYNMECWTRPIMNWSKDRSGVLTSRFSTQVSECLHYVQDMFKEKDNECIKNLNHAVTMLKIIYNMVIKGKSVLVKLYGDAEKAGSNENVLKEDYMRGREFLERLQKGEKEEEIGLLEEKLKQIASIINEPWKKFENEYKAEVNKEIIEFLLSMYYENKRRNAWGRKEYKGGK